jgi:ABC-2 type transport system permease protein
MRKVLSIGRVNTVRFLRERSNIFFVFLLPLLIILLLGAMYASGFDSKVGVYVGGGGGPLAESLVAAVDGPEGISVTRYDSAAAMAEAVQRGTMDGGLTIPAGYDADLAAGEVVEVTFTGRMTDQASMLLAEAVRGAVASEAEPIRAARFVESQGVASFEEALPIASDLAEDESGRITVVYREAGESAFEEFEGLGSFDFGSSQELVLFMFLTSLAGSASLIQTRRLGVARRMLSTPTSTQVILGGETLGRYSIALTQGAYIMVGTLLLFRVDWGDPIGAVAIVVVFALVGAAGAMLLGALFSNDQQAGSIGVLLGLGLAAVGGAMAPIELFPDTMKTVAKFTPHAWAIDGFAELTRRDGHIVDILPHLGVLAAFAAAFMLLGAWRLRRVLTR